MHRLLADLIDLLALERLDPDRFRGRTQDLGWRSIFGGQVLGQALSAAAQTVPPERAAHSLHGYFLRAGDVTRPIVYEVERLRDGHSFTTRRVIARQPPAADAPGQAGDAGALGEAIFSLEASFHVHEEGFDHQDPMPEVPPPESLKSERDLALAVTDQLPAALRTLATDERVIEIRPVDPRTPLRPRPMPPRRHLWCRTIDKLPDDAALHQYVLAYASDFSFLGTALDPHGVSWLTPNMQVASLDHALWFHRPFRLDDWILYAVESPSAAGGRGLVRGRFFDRAGRLIASTTQEGLMRRRS
ncbi:MAG TPA: acyl-CoA thioesterase II [Polyangia bacterium]|jgi:acyl-CoA thioesterase-2|nr:acyl-CoA thioesterase II [Polyangia bacterium]